MYILAEALQNFIDVHAASTLKTSNTGPCCKHPKIQTQVSLEKFNHMLYIDPIMPHSAGTDQYAFHTFILVPDNDLSTFTTGRAHFIT